MIENIKIEDMVPAQIIELIKKLQDTLEIIKSSKNTVSKVASFEKIN